MATKKPKSYNYILVLTSEGPVFVTKIETGKYARWDKSEVPLEMDLDWAKEIALGLTWNGNVAFPVSSKYEITTQPYNYADGHFEWKWNDDKEEN